MYHPWRSWWYQPMRHLFCEAVSVSLIRTIQFFFFKPRFSVKGSDVCKSAAGRFPGDLHYFGQFRPFGFNHTGDGSKSVKFCRFRGSYKSHIRKYKDVGLGYPSEVGEGTNPNLRRGWVAWVIFWAEEGLNKVKRGGDSCVMNVVASLRWRKASSE